MDLAVVKMTGPESFYPDIGNRNGCVVVTLPEWLNQLVFDKLGGTCNPARSKRSFDSNLDATESEVLTYLGTYFPRSLAESFVIFDCMLSDSSYADTLAREGSISICSVGTGTGGDLFGLLLALDRRLPRPKRIEVVSIEGNKAAHEVMHRASEIVCPLLLSEVSLRRIDLTFKPPRPFEKIEDYLPNSPNSYDYILSSKMLNELDGAGVSKRPYYEFCGAFAPLLKRNGALLLLDVTSANGAGGRWTPKQLNGQVNDYLTENSEFRTILPLLCNKFERECNQGCYTQSTIRVAYRNETNVCTKICYRVIGRSMLAERLAGSTALWSCPITEDNRGHCRAFQR